MWYVSHCNTKRIELREKLDPKPSWHSSEGIDKIQYVSFKYRKSKKYLLYIQNGNSPSLNTYIDITMVS